MANILQRLGAFRNKAVTVSLETPDGPQEFRFYPPRMRMLISGRMKEILEPIFKAASVLFRSDKQDTTKFEEVTSEGTVTRSSQGISAELFTAQQAAKEQAVREVLQALMRDDTRYQIGELLADSMRDDFSDKEAERVKEARQFIDEVPPEVLWSLLKGYMQAILPVLGKEGKSLLSGLQETVAREIQRVREAGDNVIQMPQPTKTEEPVQ